MGLGSRMLSSLAKLRLSSSRSTIEGWRKMMLLMVLTGDDAVEAIESRLLETEDDRRKEVRRVVAEKRAAMAWNREDCIMGAQR